MRLPPISSPPEFAAASKLTSGPPLVFMRPRRRGYTSAKSSWRRRSFISPVVCSALRCSPRVFAVVHTLTEICGCTRTGPYPDEQPVSGLSPWLSPRRGHSHGIQELIPH
jgi:hypothetical protein